MLSKFFHELHRRRVLRVLAVYVVVCFFLINSLVGAVEYYDWSPVWVTRSIFIALVMTPVVAVISWVFDYTQWGILRTPPQGELPLRPSGLMDRRVEAIILLILLIVAGISVRETYREYALQRSDAISEQRGAEG
ncbi:MAG: hypothetical protein O3A63_21760 [Proteobacteria bacterium]|nr:hypothetical protein [Pseudomonadota bacterium]